MTNSFILRNDVHAVFIGSDLVALDVRKDQYLCLADARDGGELSVERDRVFVRTLALEADLKSADLGAPEVIGPPRRLLPSPARRSALTDHYPPPALGDLPHAANALVDTARYHHRRFAHLVGGPARRSRPDPHITPELLDAVARHHRWSPFLPVPGKCLLQSFLLLQVLRRQGLDAVWVFGVRTWPFHAHCWLQCEDMVLNDTAERTWAYTPILAA